MKPFGVSRDLEIYRRSYMGQLGDRSNGLLFIPRRGMRVIFSDGGGWEHVSVSIEDRCPSWEEMCWVRKQFWDPEATVLQFHPPQSVYVNCHPHCLHLWRPVGQVIELPPAWMVGPVEAA